jgi:hypothetical protein
MKRLSIAISIAFLALGIATTASAQSRCDGDFELVHGSWIATQYCQRLVAERIANRDHTHITRHTERAGDVTPDEFCRWHNGEIETSTYCSSYND